MALTHMRENNDAALAEAVGGLDLLLGWVPVWGGGRRVRAWLLFSQRTANGALRLPKTGGKAPHAILRAPPP